MASPSIWADLRRGTNVHGLVKLGLGEPAGSRAINHLVLPILQPEGNPSEAATLDTRPQASCWEPVSCSVVRHLQHRPVIVGQRLSVPLVVKHLLGQDTGLAPLGSSEGGELVHQMSASLTTNSPGYASVDSQSMAAESISRVAQSPVGRHLEHYLSYAACSASQDSMRAMDSSISSVLAA